VGEALIYIEKGVAAPAPETSLKWLGRTREGGPTCLRHTKSYLISYYKFPLTLRYMIFCAFRLKSGIII
jgi:hypothetical protein